MFFFHSVTNLKGERNSRTYKDLCRKNASFCLISVPVMVRNILTLRKFYELYDGLMMTARLKAQ